MVLVPLSRHVFRAFHQRNARYHGKTLPSQRVIQYVINNFEKHGAVEDRRKIYTVDRPWALSPRKDSETLTQ